MRNRQMLNKLSVKCLTAILSAALLMSSAAVTVAFPVTVYADEGSNEGSNPNVQQNADGSVRVFSEAGNVTENVGDVEATTENGEAALTVEAKCEGANVTVTANNVTNENPAGDGLKTEADDKGTTNVNVIAVSGGISAEANGGSNTVTVGDNKGGISAEATGSGSNSVKVFSDNEGGISAEANGGSNTVSVRNNTGGISAEATDKGSNTVSVEVSNKGGISAEATGIGENYVTVFSDNEGGISAEANDGFNTVTVIDDNSGDISANADNGGSNRVGVSGYNYGGISAEATGSGSNKASNKVIVSRDNNGGIDAQAKTGGVNVILIGGNAGGANTEAGLSLASENGGENHVVIEGTLTARNIGVLINEDSSNELPEDTLTVWKIEQPEGDNGPFVLAGYQDANGQYVADDKAAKTIQYIIRVAPPETGVTSLTATDANGGALKTTKGVEGDEGKDLQWAHEGEKVLLKIDLQEGYSLLGAYGDEGHVELSKDGQTGYYYIKVPRGGGVVLSVKVGTSPYDPSQQPTPAPNPVPNPARTPGYHDQASNSDSSAGFGTQQNLSFALVQPQAGYTISTDGSEMHFVVDNGQSLTLPLISFIGLLSQAQANDSISNFVFQINGITYSILKSELANYITSFTSNTSFFASFVTISIIDGKLVLKFGDEVILELDPDTEQQPSAALAQGSQADPGTPSDPSNAVLATGTNGVNGTNDATGTPGATNVDLSQTQLLPQITEYALLFTRTTAATAIAANGTTGTTGASAASAAADAIAANGATNVDLSQTQLFQPMIDIAAAANAIAANGTTGTAGTAAIPAPFGSASITPYDSSRLLHF